jgi:hypothetical protein
LDLGAFAAVGGVASGLVGLSCGASGDAKCGQLGAGIGFGLMGVSIPLLVLGMNPPALISVSPRGLAIGGTW